MQKGQLKGEQNNSGGLVLKFLGLSVNSFSNLKIGNHLTDTMLDEMT